MYQAAIESNYSHEQMTPLNSILGNSNILMKRFIEMQQELVSFDPGRENSIRDVETLVLLKAINQSGLAMQLYNQNQIQRMKIEKKQFRRNIPYKGTP